jgi:hypothetical protein
MLTIRDQHLAAFSRIRLRQWLASYLVTSYPRQVSQLGQPGLESLLDAATAGARRRGLLAPAEIRKYLHVNFLLGLDFESDPGAAWARRILDDSEQPDPAERLAELEHCILLRLEDASPQPRLR